jgi:hypothetical protein
MSGTGPEGIGDVRQAAIDALCEHFASDAISVEEFERRVELAHRAESTDELRRLLADLPGSAVPAPRNEGGARPEDLAPATVLPSRVKERGLMVAALGGIERKGRWIPARQNVAVAVMGGVVLDFREALMAPGVTEVWIFTLMGGAEILVPPGLSVESDGVAILGGFEHRDDAPLHDLPDRPLLRLRGLAVMGGVEVSIRLPGESARDARKRLRGARREQRRVGRGS